MSELAMELRAVDVEQRQIVGVVAPYDEVSYLTPDPGGERIMRGAFTKSITQRGGKVRLFVGHNNRVAGIGHATDWTDDTAGLSAVFTVSSGARADEALEDARNDMFGGLSVGFRSLTHTRGRDGVLEIREGALEEVSLVGVPAYASARVMAVRSAENLDVLLAPFRNPPAVNLSPMPTPWAYHSMR